VTGDTYDSLHRGGIAKPTTLLHNGRSQNTSALQGRIIEGSVVSATAMQLTALMTEQNFTQAVRIADRGYVIVHGRIAVEGRSAEELNNHKLIRKFYLGFEDAPPGSGGGAGSAGQLAQVPR
jgi:branched-chain amino acid transport system ATP-binding protein